jgi:hypothetical protein
MTGVSAAAPDPASVPPVPDPRPDQIARLRDRLAELETEYATLEAELAAFHPEYLRRVGVVMARVNELEAKILMRLAKESGSPDDAWAAYNAGEQARRTTAEAKAIPEPGGPVPTADLKTLFRDAAKRMHPDLAPSDAARKHAEAFMKRLNQAYRAGDATAITDLVRQWGGGPAAAPDTREASALEAAVARAEQRLADLRATGLAEILERVMAASARGEDLLATMRTDAEVALRDAQARWEAMQA